MKLKLFLILLFGVLLINSCSDQPKELSGKVEVIEVHYIAWACDCARFIETKYYDDPNYEVLAEDCIFIDPSSLNLVIPESYDPFEYNLKLKGQYYLDKGIPDSYPRTGNQMMEKARVFRYDSFEFVRK